MTVSVQKNTIPQRILRSILTGQYCTCYETDFALKSPFFPTKCLKFLDIKGLEQNDHLCVYKTITESIKKKIDDRCPYKKIHKLWSYEVSCL